jgi:hypothetical protein
VQLPFQDVLTSLDQLAAATSSEAHRLALHAAIDAVHFKNAIEATLERNALESARRQGPALPLTRPLEKWSLDEDVQLRLEFESGMTLDVIAGQHVRTPLEVAERLHKPLGLLTEQAVEEIRAARNRQRAKYDYEDSFAAEMDDGTHGAVDLGPEHPMNEDDAPDAEAPHAPEFNEPAAAPLAPVAAPEPVVTPSPVAVPHVAQPVQTPAPVVVAAAPVVVAAPAPVAVPAPMPAPVPTAVVAPVPAPAPEAVVQTVTIPEVAPVVAEPAPAPAPIATVSPAPAVAAAAPVAPVLETPAPVVTVAPAAPAPVVAPAEPVVVAVLAVTEQAAAPAGKPVLTPEEESTVAQIMTKFNSKNAPKNAVRDYVKSERFGLKVRPEVQAWLSAELIRLG